MFGPPPPAAFDPSQLVRGSDLRRMGIEPARAGWVGVRRGFWIRQVDFDSLTPLQRHAALVHAANRAITSAVEPVFCGPSAAALLTLPRIGPWPNAVRLLADPSQTDMRRQRGGSGPASRRSGACPTCWLIHDIRCTPPARTVIDLARFDSLENPLVAADHVLRHQLCDPDALTAEAAGLAAGQPGRRPALLTAKLANGLAHLPGESVSRLQVFRLNLPKPELQVPFNDADGLIGYVDFLWRRRGKRPLVGEFDGRVKYRLGGLTSQTDIERTLWEEKRREDRLRKQADVVRWTWTSAIDASRLGRELAAYDITPGAAGMGSWLDGRSAPEVWGMAG